MTHLDAASPAPAGTFGSLLRTLREAAGLTQEELAERAGLTSYAVSALERGRRQRPYPHTVRCLVEALGASDEQRSLLVDAIPKRSSASAGPVQVDGVEPAVVPSPRLSALPATPTRLVGRDEETRALVALLREHRLVTLTGTGGVGKSRLATAVAAQLADAFPDGAALVSLAPLSDPATVLPTVARAVGSAVVEGPEAAAALAEHLRPLHRLLVLDNLEHLLEAAEQVAALVADCPRLAVLVTSRAPLRVRGETEFPVQPLAVPDETSDLDGVRRCAAVEVFTDRGRSVSPGFEVTPANAPAVAALCRHLAGIPLALELAAARLRFLDPQALLARLDDAMARAGGPDLPARQRTMRATFDWSYDLLAPPEQRLLRALSVFHGGATLEAVEDVGADPDGDGTPVLALLEVLVEHSLVVVTSDGEGRPRFGLLEPIAQYARSRQSQDERDRLQAAHAAHFLAFAERASPEYQAADQVVWLDRTEREDANLTAALSWATGAGDGETAGRIGWALWLFWWLRGRLAVGRRLMEQALPLDMPAVVRTRATLTAACMAFALGDVEVAGARWREAEVLALAGEDGAAPGQATAGVGLVHLALGDLAAAEDHFLRALPYTRGGGRYEDWLQSLVHVWLGTVHLLRGDLARAVPAMEDGLRSARRRGDRLTAYVALYNLSQAAIGQGRHDVARAHLHEGIGLTGQTGDLANLVYFLEALAVVESATGDADRVATLLGAAEAVREAAGAQVYGYYKPDPALREQAADAARAAVGQDRFDDGVDAGRSLSPDEAITYALTGPAAS